MTRRLVPFLAAALLLMVPSVASAHTAVATMACEGRSAVLRIDAVDYQGTNHIFASVDHHVVVDTDFLDSFHDVQLVGSGAVAHKAVVQVTASDGEQYDRTFDLSSPPCIVVHHRPNPRAAITGPCGDPLYRFVLVAGDVATTFRVSYTAYSSHALRVFHVTVAAHTTAVTPYHHVLGGTAMRVGANSRTLAAKVSAPGGSYGKCQK